MESARGHRNRHKGDIYNQVEWPAEYRHTWHVIRQDSHVVWRGDEITPAVASTVVACLRGETPS